MFHVIGFGIDSAKNTCAVCGVDGAITVRTKGASSN